MVWRIPLVYLISGNIIPSLCIITKTIPTAEATSNNGKMLLCPSACKKVLNPNGLAAKNNNATRTDESIANSLLRFLLLCDVWSADVELCAIWRYQSTYESDKTYKNFSFRYKQQVYNSPQLPILAGNKKWIWVKVFLITYWPFSEKLLGSVRI